MFIELSIPNLFLCVLSPNYDFMYIIQCSNSWQRVTITETQSAGGGRRQKKISRENFQILGLHKRGCGLHFFSVLVLIRI